MARRQDRAQGPERSCVGCRQKMPEEELLRLVAVPADVEGQAATLAIDWSGKLPGRGAYLSPKVSCVRKALRKKAIQRALQVPVTVPEPDVLLQSMRDGLERVFGQRLALARRAGAIISGEARVQSCLKLERGLLLILASDMSAGNRRKYEMNAERKGLPVVSPMAGDVLGKRIGRGFAGIILVEAQPFAAHLERTARQLAGLRPEEAADAPVKDRPS